MPSRNGGGRRRRDGRLLIHAEQGFGDTLQFCRYAPLAAARGLRVVMEVPKALVRLLQGLAGVDQVVGRGEPLPDFDLHCPMLSLPLALGPALATIPVGAYLQADALQVAAWRMRLGAMVLPGRRIGLAWAGNPALRADIRRSLAPDRLAPLFDLAGVHFFSLQKDGPAAPANPKLTDLMAEMADFADTASLVANLDLLISVDTAVAHLAAALGKPVRLLDRFDPAGAGSTDGATARGSDTAPLPPAAAGPLGFCPRRGGPRSGPPRRRLIAGYAPPHTAAFTGEKASACGMTRTGAR